MVKKLVIAKIKANKRKIFKLRIQVSKYIQHG